MTTGRAGVAKIQGRLRDVAEGRVPAPEKVGHLAPRSRGVSFGCAGGRGVTRGGGCRR